MATVPNVAGILTPVDRPVASKMGVGRSPFTITKSDTVNFTYGAIRRIYVGGTGDVVVVTKEGEVITYSAVPVGTYIDGHFIRVNSTGTTATLMVGEY